MARLLDVGSYGSTKPNINFVQRMTSTRRPATVGKVSCFFRMNAAPAENREYNLRPSTTTTRNFNEGNDDDLSPPAMMRSLEAAAMAAAANYSEDHHNLLRKFPTVRTTTNMESLTPQRLETGLPLPRSYHHPMSSPQDAALSPLQRHELSGRRETLASSVLRDARRGMIRPVTVAQYDLQSGTRYVEHRDAVNVYHASQDARRARHLKREFAKPLTSLRKYHVVPSMNDVALGHERKGESVPMHLRDRERRRGGRGGERGGERGGRGRRGERRRRGGQTGGRSRVSGIALKESPSLMIDNRPR